MRLFPETGELVQEAEKYTHKQDNNQSSQQANSQNISLYLPQSVPCAGNSIVLEIKNKKPFQWVYENACEAHPLYWCLKENYLDFFPLASQKMLFLAQKTTAGFYYSFFHSVM